MPYGHATIAMEVIDFDEGDDTWNGADWDEVSAFLNDRLVAFKVEDGKGRIDKLELTYRNGDFAMFEMPAFAKGQKLLLSWGWPGQHGAPRRFIVEKVHGSDVVTVNAKGTVVLLNKRPKGRFMEGVTDSEWVRTVAEEYGYVGPVAHIDETTVRRDISQPAWMTDAQMCRKLARRNDFQFYIDGDGLHWQADRDDRDPVRVFFYRTDLERGTILEPPRIEGDLSKGVARVRVLGYDPITKQPVEATYGVDDDDVIDMALYGEVEDPDEADPSKRAQRVSMEMVLPAGLLSEEEAKLLAQSNYRMFSKRSYKMEMKIIGDASITGKDNVGVYSLSESLDGIFRVDKKVDLIVPGSFTSTLSCTRSGLTKNPASKMKRKRNPSPAAAAQEPPPDSQELKRVLISRVNANGETVASWIFTDDGGATGQTSDLTPAEYYALSEAQREALAQQGVQSALPDQ